MQNKLHFKNMTCACQSQLRLCISLKDPAILREEKKKTTKTYMGRASQR